MTLALARVAHAPWWRRLLAWWRTRGPRPVLPPALAWDALDVVDAAGRFTPLAVRYRAEVRARVAAIREFGHHCAALPTRPWIRDVPMPRPPIDVVDAEVPLAARLRARRVSR
jgi:hypothetical protein